MDVLDVGGREGLPQMLLIELWRVFGTRQCSYVNNSTDVEHRENGYSLIPGAVRKSYRVDIEAQLLAGGFSL